MDPEYIERMVRAFIPWPVAWFTSNDFDGKVIKIFESELLSVHNQLLPGKMFSINDKICISTKDKHTVLRIKRLQIEGKTQVNEKDFLNGLGKSLRKLL
jgi:methionyl-tRNA formyltransferase